MIAWTPKETKDQSPVFEGIEEFKGTEEEFNNIREAGSSVKELLKYGIFRDDEHPELEKMPDEFGDD
jgi:hypothetical protein